MDQKRLHLVEASKALGSKTIREVVHRYTDARKDKDVHPQKHRNSERQDALGRGPTLP